MIPNKTLSLSLAAAFVVAGASLAGCDRGKTASEGTGAAVTTPSPTTAPTTTTAVTTPAPADATTAATTAPVDDTATTERVKTAMLNDPDMKGVQVNVATSNGTVTLSGTMETKAQADKAGEIARQTAGVSSVTNNLSARS